MANNRDSVAATQCPIWVINGLGVSSEGGPLIPQPRTCGDCGGKSGSCRYCCKSRKSTGLENLAKDDFSASLPLQSPAGPIRSSMVVFLVSDVVPHVSARETHQRA
jgi:hypothetical protein